jgi:hypothetical protein
MNFKYIALGFGGEENLYKSVISKVSAFVKRTNALSGLNKKIAYRLNS